MAAFYPQIAVAYTQIVTITTDNILETNEFRSAVGAQWTFLSDAGRKVQKDLDIQEYTDNILETNEFRSAVGAQWTFLSDAGRKVQKDLDIQEYTDPHHDPMIPYTLVLEPGLIINKIYNGYWFWGRPSTEQLWQDLRDVTERVRPDWDITKPALREAWAQGDKRLFYPYKERT